MLEKLIEFKVKPKDIIKYKRNWFEAHSVFAFETFLYTIAGLVKTKSYKTLHTVFTHHFRERDIDGIYQDTWTNFNTFYSSSETLRMINPEWKRRYAPVAEYIKLHADRNDIPLKEVIQADLLALMMACLNNDVRYWVPWTVIYNQDHLGFPLFLDSARSRDFNKLIQITGIDDVKDLRERVLKGYHRLMIDENTFPAMPGRNVWYWMNMDELNTLS